MLEGVNILNVFYILFILYLGKAILVSLYSIYKGINIKTKYKDIDILKYVTVKPSNRRWNPIIVFVLLLFSILFFLKKYPDYQKFIYLNKIRKLLFSNGYFIILYVFFGLSHYLGRKKDIFYNKQNKTLIIPALNYKIIDLKHIKNMKEIGNYKFILNLYDDESYTITIISTGLVETKDKQIRDEIKSKLLHFFNKS